MPHTTHTSHDQQGQTTTEMAVILALVVIVGFIAVTFFGGQVAALWSSFSSAYPG
jgi:Flp pilus assembly pilin Flp